MTKRRVAVTGMGVVSPLGTSVEDFAHNLLDGASGIGPITLFDASALPTRIAGEVKVLPSGPWPPLRDRKAVFALEAARQAMEAACACGSRPGGGDATGGSLVLGIGLELFSMEDLAKSRQPGFAWPEQPIERSAFLQTPSDLCVPMICGQHALGAPPLTLVSACAAGTDAIGTAFRMVATGRRSFALCGGADSMVNPLGVGGFCKLGALSTRNGEPARASRPFERRRDGFVLGEGAGMLVLEPLEDARSRGARVLCEIAGYGSTFDAYGISEPHPEGRGAYQAMAAALTEAGIGPEEIDAVNAHGTGTPKNDPVETRALKALLGARAGSVPVSATKSMIGHLVSAAGAVEAIAAIACMRAGFVHPTINLDEPDPECDLDYVPHAARRHAQRHVLSTSFGFGGQNAAIVIRNAGA